MDLGTRPRGMSGQFGPTKGHLALLTVKKTVKEGQLAPFLTPDRVKKPIPGPIFGPLKDQIWDLVGMWL